MASPAEHLERWRTAGLIDAAHADRILAFEREQASPERNDEDGRPSALEALLYLGIAVAVVGVFTLVAQNWENLRTWARIAILALPGALLLLAGAVMRPSTLRRYATAAGFSEMEVLAIDTGPFRFYRLIP